MGEILVGLLIFACLVTASIGTMATHGRMPPHHRDDDTTTVVRLVANIFVVMTSLGLGLMINSSRNTLEEVDRNVHALAAQTIVLDRTLLQYGAGAEQPRQKLHAYVRQALEGTWPKRGEPVVVDPVAEDMLDQIGRDLRKIVPPDAEHAALLAGARQQFLKVVDLRWTMVEHGGGAVPGRPFIVMLVAWLVLIFASFGYRAPRNPVVITLFIVAAALMACAIYLIVDMERPFDGPIRVSSEPFEQALAEMRR